MSKVFYFAPVVLVIACLAVGNYLWADTEAENGEAAEANVSIWIGVTLLQANEEDNEYLIGTIDKNILDQIELGKYNRKFLRISNLRLQEEVETEEGGKKLVHHDCADQYDWGVILVRYEDVLSIELKKGDPLELVAE